MAGNLDMDLDRAAQARAQGAGDIMPPRRAPRRRIQTVAAKPQGGEISALIIIDGKQEPVTMSRSVAASLAQALVRALA
jgi:hypothetical protein